MLSPVTTRQLDRVRIRYPDVQIQPLPSGAALVTIPTFSLPGGWNASSTCVRFILPVGYPGPHPDCFWASTGLRLANGQLPQASQEPNPIPETPYGGLWFSWHVVDAHANWNPNRDDISTYINIIAERFRRLQ
ncbi:E2/UBC family protein [Bradyrhizobium sp. BR 1432]|uniref:E2/UBC family protein n=1 Tax=Bradyrhizobium sp. BR 1432 TaxID=3447966 RepID=UPI003EE6E360